MSTSGFSWPWGVSIAQGSLLKRVKAEQEKGPEEMSWGGEGEAVGKHRRKNKREKK